MPISDVNFSIGTKLEAIQVHGSKTKSRPKNDNRCLVPRNFLAFQLTSFFLD